MKLDFQIPASLDDFFTSEKFIALAVGPVGSLKTTTAIAKILYHASRMAACRDGVRRSRAIWVRNTREQLRDTSIPDVLKWLPDGVAGNFSKTESKFVIRLGDIECEVLFRGLDDAQDVRRLLSLQASFGILEEFREINPQIFEQLQGRLGRYPDGMMVPHRPEWGVDEKGNPVQGCVTDAGESNRHIWGVTNPPDFDTYWEQFLSDPPENAHVTIQPSAMSADEDWSRFLPSDYYENLVLGKSEDWIDVYVHAKFGKSLSGQPVFKAFKRELHISKEPLKWNPGGSALVVGMDVNLNPAAVIGQMAYDGRLFVFDALHAEGMGALRFLRERLKPMLSSKYPGAKVVVAVDPAGMQRAPTDEKTVVHLIKQEGFAVKPARSNNLPPRIASVDNFLTRIVDGRPAIVMDPQGCAELIKAMAGKYRYKIKKPGSMDEQVDDEPEKLHPWSDLADALQYLCMHADGGIMAGALAQTARREVKNAPFRWAI